MSNRFVITDQTGKAIAAANKFGDITDIYIKAGGGGTAYVALYDGQSAVAANLLCIHSVAAGQSKEVTNCKIQFTDAGAYALVDANVEALVVWLTVGGGKATPVLSGG